MNIISNNSRYLPHNLTTRYNAILTYRNGNKSSYVCRKYHISYGLLYLDGIDFAMVLKNPLSISQTIKWTS
jgi:hypothetical protein